MKNREIVCPVKQRWLGCRQQKQREKNLCWVLKRRYLFTFRLRTFEDDGMFGFW